MAHQIFLVDDHPVTRHGYAALIDEAMDLEVVGETGSVEEARRYVSEARPDLVVVDLFLEGGSGLDLTKDLLAMYPDLAILIVSMHDETLYADRALQAGARGYLMKSEDRSNVIKAIRRVLEGGIYLSQELRADILLQHTRDASAKHESPIEQLTDRELEVFEYLGRGFTAHEIAEKLRLSPKTIDSYRINIKEKLAVETNAQLRRRAVVWVEQCGQSGEGRGD